MNIPSVVGAIGASCLLFVCIPGCTPEGSSPNGKDTPRGTSQPTAPPTPKTHCQDTQPKPAPAINCGPEDVCGKLDDEFCLVPKVISATYPREDCKATPKYDVYWGPKNKWESTYPKAIIDPFYEHSCVLNADFGDASSFSLVGGTAPVIAGRRVRGASTGTIFATQIETTMVGATRVTVERAIVLLMSNSGEFKLDVVGGTSCLIKPAEITNYYILISATGGCQRLRYDAGTPEAATAKKFRSQMALAACKAGLTSYVVSMLKTEAEFKYAGFTAFEELKLPADSAPASDAAPTSTPSPAQQSPRRPQ